MALLITSNYNTCEKRILRYANLVGPPLVLMHVAEVGKLGYIVGRELNVVYTLSFMTEGIAFRPYAPQYRKNGDERPRPWGFWDISSAVLRYFRPKISLKDGSDEYSRFELIFYGSVGAPRQRFYLPLMPKR